MSKEIENFNSNFYDEIFDIAFVLKESCLGAGKAHKDKYDTLLDKYELGLTTEKLDNIKFVKFKISLKST